MEAVIWVGCLLGSRHRGLILAHYSAPWGRSAWFARFLDDGRICFTNNAVERALRGICTWQEVVVRGFGS
jgi:hypothetical protein